VRFADLPMIEGTTGKFLLQQMAAVAELEAGMISALRPLIEEIMRAGVTSHNAIAAKLNERNVRTARGGVWTHVQVGAILHPFEGASAAAVA
jgi:hypothetical protein